MCTLVSTEVKRPLYQDKCTPLKRREQLIVLRRRGGGPLGAFNKNYMAFTLKEAKAFPNLVNRSVKAKESPAQALIDSGELRRSRFPETTLTGPCQTTVNGLTRACSACPAFTDLGPNVIPRFINEVRCAPGFQFCGFRTGLCRNSVLVQTFLRRTGRCDDDGKEFLAQFTQEIRSCCECALFG